jgi:multiple sugar transport system permease protein
MALKRLSVTRGLGYIVLCMWSVVSIFPLYWVAITSLKGEDAIVNGARFLPFVDFTPTLDAWRYILTYENDFLLLRFLNSSIVALMATLITVLCGAMAVYGLTRFRPASMWMGKVFGNGTILFAILATRILPPIVVALPIYFMARFTGTLDTRLALVLTYGAANLPVAVWLLRPVFGSRASQQEEAATLDGASHMQVFFAIFLPMVATGLFATGLLVFILCWNEYLFAAYLATNDAMTLPPWVIGQMSIKEAQTGGEGQDWAHLSAATIFMVTPVLACTALAQRFLGRMALWNR